MGGKGPVRSLVDKLESYNSLGLHNDQTLDAMVRKAEELYNQCLARGLGRGLPGDARSCLPGICLELGSEL